MTGLVANDERSGALAETLSIYGGAVLLHGLLAVLALTALGGGSSISPARTRIDLVALPASTTPDTRRPPNRTADSPAPVARRAATPDRPAPARIVADFARSAPTASGTATVVAPVAPVPPPPAGRIRLADATPAPVPPARATSALPIAPAASGRVVRDQAAVAAAGAGTPAPAVRVAPRNTASTPPDIPMPVAPSSTVPAATATIGAGPAASATRPEIAPSANPARITAAAPSPQSGLAPTATTLAAVGGAAIDGSGSGSVATSDSLSPVGDEPQRLAALETPQQRAPAIGATDAGRTVQDYLRTYEGSGCFVAVAAQTGEDSFAVSGFSRTSGEWAEFNRALDARTGYRFASRARQVSDAQCAALAFARKQPAYPAFESRIALRSDRLDSGAEIEGRILGAARRHLTLFLVDDEGLVQDVTALLQEGSPDGAPTFRTPLTLTAGPVETVQLLVSVASDAPLPPLPPEGADAAAYFAGLTRSLARPPEEGVAGADVALAAFSVE